ncbi:MAG TPA: 2OG-Fe(II) oxygenase family protein, partial [Polyangia bacterium]
PDHHNYPVDLGRVLLEAGHPERAAAEAKAYLARQPGHSAGLALDALASLALGDEAAAARYFDYATVVSATRLPVPQGFADIATFNKALAAHAASHPTLMSAPASHSTYAGLHSGSLLVEPRGPGAPFEEAVEAAVGDCWERLSQATEQPFAARRPDNVVLAMWCIVLGRGSHQGPHIHPAAWLSGVYYPQVPESIRTGTGPEGWLEFGQPDRPFPTKIPPPIHRVRPEEGLIVIFPSYLYHRTIPFAEDATRISVAFDVVPI